LRYYIF